MPKRAKRAKAKLRKSGTADDINEFNAAQAFEARTGGDLAQVPDDALFTMDAEPDHIAAAGQSTRASRKAAARAHTLAVDQILAVNVPQAYPAPGKYNKREGPNSIKKLLNTVPHIAKAKQAKVASSYSKSKRKGSKASYDLWDTEDFGANNEDVIAASAKKPRVSKKMAGIKPLNAVPAIEVDTDGCSYNPPQDAHQEVLAQAVAEENLKNFAKELQPTKRPLTRTAINSLVEEELYRTHGDGDDESDEDDSAAGPSVDAVSEQAAKRSKVVVNNKLTKTERNKLAIKKERQREHMAAAAQKRLRKQVNTVNEIQKELEDEDQRREHERLRRLTVKQEKLQHEPRRLGKRRFQPEPLQVQLTEEVTGSLRQLKGCPTLLRDRYKSFQKREMIEPRVQQKSKKSKMYLVQENGTKGESTRESHHALMAEIAERNLGKSML